MTSLLRNLEWIPNVLKIKFQLLCLILKTLKKPGPFYLSYISPIVPCQDPFASICLISSQTKKMFTDTQWSLFLFSFLILDCTRNINPEFSVSQDASQSTGTKQSAHTSPPLSDHSPKPLLVFPSDCCLPEVQEDLAELGPGRGNRQRLPCSLGKQSSSQVS